MAITFYNSLSRQLEVFEPLEEGKVGIYSCGPTVYDFPHIGNWRANIFVDLLHRYLEYRGFEIYHIMNITDVDDKTIRGARDAGISLKKYTEPFVDAFFVDMELLRIQRVHKYPRATLHIDQMLDIVQSLQQKELTYESKGSIYYAVDRFPNYGKLSQVDLKGLRPGARVDSDEYEKEEARDFVLWKAYKPEDGDVRWSSPFGDGRPGWHLECSAMSMQYLGNPFDIHTGGIDLLFPHHENEIAQTEGATGKSPARYWLHNEYLLVDGRKMSKSLDNFYTLNDLIAKGIDPISIRYVLLATHYRQQLNFKLESLEGAGAAVARINEAARLWQERSSRSEMDGSEKKLLEESEAASKKATNAFTTALDSDLNISEGLAAVFELVREGNSLLEQGVGSEGASVLHQTLTEFDSVLGLLDSGSADDSLPDDIQALVDAREEARQQKDWAKADQIRDQILKAGFVVEDTPDGPRWKRV